MYKTYVSWLCRCFIITISRSLIYISVKIIIRIFTRGNERRELAYVADRHPPQQRVDVRAHLHPSDRLVLPELVLVLEDVAASDRGLPVGGQRPHGLDLALGVRDYLIGSPTHERE